MSDPAAVHAQQIQRAFIDGIRTVVIIDDQMSTFDEALRLADEGLLDQPIGEVADASAAESPIAGEVPIEGGDGGSADAPASAGPPVVELASASEDEDLTLHDDLAVAAAPIAAGTAPVSTPGKFEKSEDQAAAALIKDFRVRGWFCDVVNKDFVGDAIERAKKCDLIVLDYRLKDDGQRSLKILDALAHSGRMHLVVLYTREREADVWFNVASTLARPLAVPPISDDEDDLSKEWAKEQPAPTEQDVVRYLSGGVPIPELPTAPKGKRINQAGGPPSERWTALNVYRHARDTFSHRTRVDNRKSLGLSGVEHLDSSSGEIKWLRCDNVFVVVQHKTPADSVEDVQGQESGERPHGGNVLVAKITNALGEWRPSVLRLMLRFARHKIAEQGFASDNQILRGKKGEAGLLVYARTGGHEERIERRRRIYARLFESTIHALLEQDSLFHAAGAEGVDDADPFSLAVAALGIDDEDKQDVFFQLNEFLAFEEASPPYLRTGTLFQLPEPNMKDWIGICVTPECDLVPRQPRPSDSSAPQGSAPAKTPAMAEAKPAPAPTRAVLWRAVKIVREVPALTKALKEAESMDYLFLYLRKEGGGFEPCALALRSNNRISKPSMFFVANQGRIIDGVFRATRVDVSEDGVPSLEEGAPKEFRFIGQLREAYATKLLQETGHHLSRVGLVVRLT